MKKFTSAFLCIPTLVVALGVHAYSHAIQHPLQSQSTPSNLLSDPFEDDPFFQSQNDILSQMHAMQKAFDRLMQTQISKMNNMINQQDEPRFGSTTHVEIKEINDELIYKIKLPKTINNKADVSVKKDNLVINLNSTHKIMHTQDYSKSVTYSQSNYIQSFKLPPEYDPQSMHTNIKGSNLIVTFKKRPSLAKGNKMKHVF